MKKNLVLIPLLSLPFLVGCKNETIVTGPFTVKIPEITGLSIDKTIANKGEDFVATFSINEEETYLILPEQLNKVTSGNKTIKEYTYKPDESKLTASFRIPAESVVGDIIIELELFDIHVVTKSEFEDALSFKNIQYLQRTTFIVNAPISTEQIEISPTVYHRIYSSSDPATMKEIYEEEYVSKNVDDTYDRYSRNDRSANYTLDKNVSADFFKTPQSENVLKKIVEMGLTYSDFKYDSYKGEYTAEFTDKIKIIFDNKKIVEYVKNPSSISAENTTYKYKEITPDLPSVFF